MSLPVDRQPLIAAFTLGIVFQAGAGAFFLYIGGQGKKIFRDGLRLALTTFIASSALWSQIAFTASLVDPNTPIGCQIAVIFASSFDQIARVALEQYLMWAINSGLKKAPDTFVPRAILVIRLVIGGIFVGFQRPQLDPVCQTSTEMFAVGIAVIASDAVMILIFVARAFMIGLVQDVREKRPGVQRSKAVLFLIAGLALWTGASVPMFLGTQSIDLIWRTALPAGALTVLLGLVAAFMGVLVLSRARASVVPHDPSLPPDMRSPREPHTRDLSSAESNYPPGRFEDLKADEADNVIAYPSGKQVVVTERSLNNAATYPAGTAYGPSAVAAIGIAVGRPSMDGRGLASISSKPSPPWKEDQWSNLKAQPKQKGSIFTRGAPASSVTVGKLAISNPILQSETKNSALNKIATVDLATAAQMERDRRDLATLQDAQSLIAQRAAPLPPAMTREEALRRTQSTKRKQIGTPSTELLAPPNQSEADFSRPVPDEAAVVTSSQRSPGVQSLRKRSPRSPPKEFSAGSPPASSPKPSVASDVPLNGPAMTESAAPSRPLTIATLRGPLPQLRPSTQGGQAAEEYNRPALPPTWPKQGSVNNTIRPSRTSPNAVQQQRAPQVPPQTQNQTVSRESPEPSLQRRGTVGLPSNPRSKGLKTPRKEGAPQPTVMFINQIEYNDPVAVQTIMQDAAAPKTAPALRESVLHRPRPIPRQHEKDRQIFPAEQSPVGHRRTRSGGSIASRLREQPASPPNLPPLPPAPKSAGYPVRPLPNDTRSMTFDEKMDLFFPAPRSAAASVPSRGSIPDIPALPSAYLMERNDSTASKSSHGNFPRSPTRSTNSTKTSVRTQSILEFSSSPARPPMPNVSKFSIDTYITADRHADDEAGNSWIPDILPRVRVRSEQSNEGAKRRSSPILPLNDGTMSESSDNKTRADEETATNWGSVHSPVIMEARQVQVPIPTLNQMVYKTSDRDRIRDLSVLDPDGGRELMTIMLDPSVERERKQTSNPTHKGSGYWHHRVGEECATFSTRKERVVSRRMPPPTPLMLSVTSKNSFVITAAEPSPLEPPEKALQAIHDQLKKLDDPDGSPSGDQQQRLRLLESLEQEMGQQENQWHEMQVGIHRDSLTTVETSSRRVSHQDISTPDLMKSERSSIAAHREARRSARLQVVDKPSMGDLSAELVLSPNSRPRSLWKRKLAEAELEFSENVADYLAPMPAPNFFAVPMAQLGSPSPPDTDSDHEEILRAREVLRRRNAPVAKLWKPNSPLHAPSQSLLWAPPARLKPVAPEDLPGIFVRPAPRKISELLPIATSQLWTDQNTFIAPVRIATVGLWRGAPIPASPMAPVPKATSRPLTQRPPRRMKRVSTLPDIVENPEPLPNKRGTLGIFQFPWGEKSDTATVQARSSNMIMAMPGTMSTGGSVIRAALEARSKQLEQDEYSSSFFDDYDDEEEDDENYISEINGEDSDGEFDETTLWEIANLLKSDQVPSKYSLLPQRQDTYMDEPVSGESVFEASDYDMEEDDDEDENQARPGLERQDSDPLNLETYKALAPVSTPQPSEGLWSSNQSCFGRPLTLGLPQPDERSWAAYIPTFAETPRAKPRQCEVMPLESTALWGSSSSSAPASTSATVPAPKPPVTLWSTKRGSTRSLTVGLPQPDEQSWAAYIPTVEEAPRAKSRQLDHVAPLESSSLWVSTAVLAQAPAWQMWTVTTNPNVQPLEEKTKRPERPGAQTMWMAPANKISSEPSGLFDPRHERTDYRASVAEPAALHMSRRPRTTHEPLPPLPVSSNLWITTQQPLVHDAETFWMTSVPVAQTHPRKSEIVAEGSQAHSRTLWTPAAYISDAEPRGLFSPGQQRNSFRTTPAEPAALETIRRPRANTEPLAQVASTELWTINNSISYEYDWITIASVGPQSPSYASSSGRSTPISESSSVKTSSTMASSMAPSITQNTTGSNFPGPRYPPWWEPGEKPSRLSVLPEDGEEPKLQPAPKPLSPAERRARRAPKPNPTRTPRRPISSATDWDDALEQAITASSRFQHRNATPRDWDNALKCALAASRPARKVATPTDWAAALEDAITLSTKPLPGATLWVKHTTGTSNPSNTLWTPSTTLVLPSPSPLPTVQDSETSHFRRRRAKAMIPKNRKAEIRAQIAAIEAGVDPSIVGLVNFRGQSLWAPRDGLARRRLTLRGAGRNWIMPQAPVRASQAVFRFWLPGSGETA